MRLFLLLLLAGPVAAQEPLKVKVTLQSKQQHTFELVGREAGNLIHFREPGKSTEIGFAATELAWIDFGLSDEFNKIEAKISQADHAGAAEDLHKLLQPRYAYLDLPSDLPRYASQLLRLQTRAGRFEAVLNSSQLIGRFTKDETLRREAQAYRAVAWLETGRPNAADQELKAWTGISAKDELAGPYYYVRASQQLTQSNFPAAHLAAAQIIAFRPRDFEWMPAGLYLSAKCYLADGKLPVAEQIIAEITTAYPQTRWAELATKLTPEIARRRQESERAKTKKE